MEDDGRLTPTPKDGADYPHFLEWYHFANGSLQPTLFRVMMARCSDPNLRLSRAHWANGSSISLCLMPG
jgi:hypothetical protein